MHITTNLRQTLAATALLALLSNGAEAARPIFGSFASASLYQWNGGEGSISADSSTYDRYQSGFASASLEDAQLHAFSSAQALPRTATGTRTIAQYWDTVTFHSGQNISLLGSTALSIDGVLHTSGIGTAYAWVRWYMGPVRNDFWNRLEQYAPAQTLTTGTTEIDDGFFIPVGTMTYFIFAELRTDASVVETGEAVADFGNTLHLSWVLPSGVTYASASGAFMSAAPVPEPQSYALMLSGLACIGYLARRRRVGESA